MTLLRRRASRRDGYLVRCSLKSFSAIYDLYFCMIPIVAWVNSENEQFLILQCISDSQKTSIRNKSKFLTWARRIFASRAVQKN